MTTTSSLRTLMPMMLISLSVLSQAQEPLTLEVAARKSIENSKQLRKAVAGFARAQAGVREVRAGFLPQISLGAQGMLMDRENKVDFGKLMGGPSLPTVLAERWNPSFVASLALQIDISGAVKSAQDQAEFRALAARIEIDRVRNQLVFETKQAYFEAARAEGQVKVASDHLAAIRKRLENTKKFEQVGNVPKFDVVSAERDLAEAEQMMLAAETHYELSLANLRTIIGSDAKEAVTLAFDAPDASTIQPNGDLALFLADAAKQRPEILEAEAAAKAAKHGVHYARRSMLPSLGLGLNYTHQPNAGPFSMVNTTSATIGLSIPLFDGGVAKARVAQARAEQESAEADADGIKDQVELQVRTAFANVNLAKARVRVAEAAMVQAREAYRLAELRYRVGVSQSSVVSPQLELASATAALTKTSQELTNAKIDLLLTEAQLEFATGRFSLTKETQKQ